MNAVHGVASGRWWDRLGVLLVVILLTAVALTFRDYGITVDEEVQNEYGKMLLSFYATGFADRTAFSYLNLYYYGGLFDLLAALLNLISPFGEYETRHLLGGLFGVWGVIGAGLLARRLAGPRAGFLAMLLLAVTATYYGHAFANPKDAPFAAAMLWVLYGICRVMEEFPRPRWQTAALLGVTLGLALAIRIGALLALAWLAVAAIIALGLQWRRHRDSRRAVRDAARFAVKLLPAVPVAYALMAVFWPWAVLEPANPVRALAMFSKFPIDLDTLYAGTWYKAAQLPASYLAGYLLVKLPELVLAGLLAAVIVVFVRRDGTSGIARRATWVAIVFAAVAPVVAFAVKKPTAYNEMRHFLFVVPPLVVIAACGLDRAWSWTRAAAPACGEAYGLALAGLAAFHVTTLVRLHPYQYVDYNVLTGGVRGAVGRYELDYWGAAMDAAALQLAAHVQREFDAGKPRREYTVSFCGSEMGTTYHFPPYLKAEKIRWRETDFYIYMKHGYCGTTTLGGKQIGEVRRLGIPLAVVEDLRGMKLPPATSRDASDSR